jgi:hypothetical protein
VHWTFRVIGSIFQALYPRGFQRLIGIVQLLYAFISGIFNGRKPLRISGLTGAIRSNLARIIPKLIRSCFVSLQMPFSFPVFAHYSSSE